MGRILISFTSLPTHGKTILCSYPHPKLGDKVVSIAIEPPARTLVGVPEEWAERIKIVQPGYDDKGKRLGGSRYYTAIMDFAEKPLDASTIILDTHTGISKARYFDALKALGGVASKFNKEMTEGQACAIHFLDKLEEANPDANIIALYHRKSLSDWVDNTKIFRTYWPELIGTSQDETIGNKFNAMYYIQKEGENLGKTRYIMKMQRGKHWQFVFPRTGLKKSKNDNVVKEMDLTCESIDDTEPLKAAWDEIFRGLGV